MKIGIIGAGYIGATAAGLFVEAGHDVVISNSRGPDTLTDVVEKIGGGARAGTIEEAADFGDVVFEAIPFGRYEELPADRLTGKIVVDASNYYPGRDGEIDLQGLTSTEVVARHLSGSRVVKAFNTMYYVTLASEGRVEDPVEDRLVLFVAGDEEGAKERVSGLIEEIGFAPVDTGPLEGSARQEPGAPVYNNPVTPEQARELLSGTEGIVLEALKGLGSRMPRFVIQEHYARSHHFDLRLEKDGVLFSWAVPKGLPEDTKQNRLAMRVDDHDLSHLDVEDGTPVEGVPGAVAKSIWDRGTYEAEQFDDEMVIVVLHGERLENRYAIFQTGGKNWLVHLMEPAEGD